MKLLFIMDKQVIDYCKENKYVYIASSSKFTEYNDTGKIHFIYKITIYQSDNALRNDNILSLFMSKLKKD